jgi:hypothetical protein
MPSTLKVFLIAAVLTTLIAVSCTKKKNPTAPSEDTTAVPEGIARITGSVKDASGAALSDVALHLVYPLPPVTRPLAHPMTPTTAVLFDTAQELTTECNGSTPLSDGVMVKLFWDSTGNGADSTDPQPRVCDDPPDCLTGPPFTVGFNEFAINGTRFSQEDPAIRPGNFWTDPAFTTVGDVFTPNKFYARIYCADGRVLWESDVVTLPPNASEQAMHFHCMQCNGIPGTPVWRLDTPYPNPAADTVMVNFGLQSTAQALVSLVWPRGTRTDTLFFENTGSGTRIFDFALGTRPNGLYTVRLRAGTYQAEMGLLKNVAGTDTLRGTDAYTFTGSDGAFRLDAAAGVTINQRGPAGEAMGTATLSSVKVIALKQGFAVAETTLAVGSQERHNISLTLRTP